MKHTIIKSELSKRKPHTKCSLFAPAEQIFLPIKFNPLKKSFNLPTSNCKTTALTYILKQVAKSRHQTHTHTFIHRNGKSHSHSLTGACTQTRHTHTASFWRAQQNGYRDTWQTNRKDKQFKYFSLEFYTV